MNKNKIVLLPLDERPCNFDYPYMMPKTQFDLIMPPKNIMGNKKIPGDINKISQWILDNAKDASAMILSLDTLVYGGILPSRLHHNKEDELIDRVDIIKKLREINPKMKLYVFGLIMRCPSYSSDDEEPDYYEKFGAEIHLYGKYTHLEKLGKLTLSDKKAFEKIKKVVGTQELNDYLTRRKTNLSVLMHALSYVTDNTIDYFVIPQDDAAVYGFTSMDQMIVREYLKNNILHTKTAMYPSADDIGMTLLARSVAELSGIKPKIYVHYSSSKGGFTIPQVEDRIVCETVKYHILSVNGIQVYSLSEADMLLAVNVGSGMFDPDKPECVMAYDIERNLAEFVNYIKYALSLKKIVAIADIAYLNMADTELTKLMQKEKLLLDIHAYAGWNTSSNTIGTTLCEAILYMIGKDDKGRYSFLSHRYYEDIGYMAYAREYITKNYLPDMGFDYRHIDSIDGKVANIVKNTINEYMNKNYPEIADLVCETTIKMPWIRMFETDVKLKIK